LYRLAILDSWDGKLIRSLARFARLRRIDPHDPDIMVTQAQVLAWAGRTAASEALYDSVLERFPDRADALAGRARTIAWGGDLDRAEGLWRTALERHPDDPELLVGLAQTLYWKGQPDLAAVYATRARAVAPEDRTARDLARAVRAALRPEIATNVDGAGDSDHNDFVAQEATVTASLGSDLRGTLRAGWRHATDPAGDGSSYWGGANLIAALGHGAVLRAGLGARRVQPDGVAARTPFPAEVGLGLRPVRFSVIEGRAMYQWQRNGWGLRTDGGVGSQQVQAFGTLPAPHQTEWHVGVSLSRGWGANNEVALVGSITNSAAAATAGVVTGSFRYRTLGLRFRQGL